ncbi:hypothetical protein [Citrobacter koseri]|uniref:hypothetical protein n=1 Tax=Citrobacter koseri TaxID=545 RepID=UPI00352612FC
MTDINEMAQRMKAAALKAIADEGPTWFSKDQLLHPDGLSLHEADAEFIALASHENVLALLDEMEALQSFRTAFNEWHDKTEWVQGDKRLDVIKPWGKHRADVLKLYIDHLESKLEAKEEQRANWFQMAQKLGEDLDAEEKQTAEMDVYRARRVSACIAACEGISTENLVNNVPIKQGLRGLNARIREADGELEALRQRIADQQGIILSARQFISEYAVSGDAGADEFVKVIDRAAGIGKGA